MFAQNAVKPLQKGRPGLIVIVAMINYGTMNVAEQITFSSMAITPLGVPEINSTVPSTLTSRSPSVTLPRQFPWKYTSGQ